MAGTLDATSAPVYSDDALVVRAQADDAWASAELVRRYHGKAYAIAYQMSGGNEEEARDLTQEAFLKAFRNLKKFRGQASFYTWLYRIVVNTCLDSRRRRRRWHRIFAPRRSREEDPAGSLEAQPDLDQQHNPLAAVTGKQLSRKISRAVERLPAKQRTAFQLKVLSELSIREIAQVMGTAEGTVKTHLFRATHALREALKDWIDAPEEANP